jgi:hypothetical protein
MKFVHYLEKISNVSIYGVSSFLIFFTFFCAVFLWVLKSKKSDLQEIAKIPLD